jgi:SAM domain (Sterile alpha motif)
MQEVADWLERLGLGQYARRFAENDISFSIQSDLTDQDLEKIGVASLAHRRLLLREIANLGETADGAPSSLAACAGDCCLDRDLACGSPRRTAACHGDVLRSDRLDRDRSEARC